MPFYYALNYFFSWTDIAKAFCVLGLVVSATRYGLALLRVLAPTWLHTRLFCPVPGSSVNLSCDSRVLTRFTRDLLSRHYVLVPLSSKSAESTELFAQGNGDNSTAVDPMGSSLAGSQPSPAVPHHMARTA